MDAYTGTSQLQNGASVPTFSSNVTLGTSLELIPSSGSYSTGDIVLDTAIFLLTMTTSMLAILVLARKHRHNSLLDHLFCLESMGSLVVASAFYIPLLLRHSGWWSDVRSNSRVCGSIAGIILSVTLAQLLNAFFLTLLRLLSITKPFLYDRKLAFSVKVLIPAVIVFILFPAIATPLFGADSQLFKLRLYGNVCMLDLRSRSQATFIYVVATFSTVFLAAILFLDLMLAYRFHKLRNPPATSYWDSAMAEQLGSGHRTPGKHAHAPLISKKRKSFSVGTGLLRVHGESLGLRPLWRCFSDTDLPTSIRTTTSRSGNELAVEESTADPVDTSRQNSSSRGQKRFRRRSLTDIKPCMYPRCLYYKIRHCSLHKLQLVQHHLKASPMTKLVMALSLSHVIGKLPGVVMVWIEVDTVTGVKSPTVVIWSIRLWIVTLVVNSFLYVLARRSNKLDVVHVLKPIEQLFHSLCCFCAASNKRHHGRNG